MRTLAPGSRVRRLGCRVAAVVALNVIIAIAGNMAKAAPALAASYDVWSCRKPDGSRASLSGWRYVGVFAPNEICPLYGFSAGLSREGSAATDTSGWWFEAPANTAISGYELFRSAHVGVGPDQTGWTYALYHDSPIFDPGRYLVEFCSAAPIAPCYDVGVPFPADPMDPRNRVVRANLNVSRLILRIECSSYNGPRACGPSESGGGSLGVARARVTLLDDAAPLITGATGSLTGDRRVLEGSQAVTLAASDEGGGVHDVAVLFDGAVVASTAVVTQHPGCSAPYVDVVPCPLVAKVVLVVDTATVHDGSYGMQYAVTDAAGNRTLSKPVPIRIANHATPNGNNPTRRARLVAAFRSARGVATSRTAIVEFGGSRVVRGRLSDADGNPIGLARLDVFGSSRRGGSKSRMGVATTRSDGTFKYTTSRGPSRRVRFEYRAYSLDEEPAAVAAVKLRVRAGLRLAVTPRRTSSRGKIRFSGRLLGTGRDGVQVALYAVDRPTRRRVPVEILTTNDRGRFSFRYRFVRTFAPFTYRFQARVSEQPGYPFAAGASRVVTVRIVR